MSKRNLSLVMVFKNDEGKDLSLTLNDVKEDLSEEIINKAMDEIINNALDPLDKNRFKKILL